MEERSRDETRRRRVIGLDVSDRRTQVCELDTESGEVMREWRVATDPDRMARAFGGRKDIERMALEAGKQSPWISRLLEELGFEVVVANARKVRLIYENRRKSDRIDAQYLARLARVDTELLHPIRHRSQGVQADLAVVRARDVLVRSRTQLINHVRGAVKSMGSRISSGSADSFARRARTEIPQELQPALLPLVRTIQELTDRIGGYDRQMQALIGGRYPECELLQAVGGVGPVTALAYRLVIADPRRFRRSRMVGPYLGLTPARDQSGEFSPQLHITKAGDALVRRLLMQAAHYILGALAMTATCGGTASGSRLAAARRRSGSPPWRWRASWRCCCIACGSRERSTTRSMPPRSRRQRDGPSGSPSLVEAASGVQGRCALRPGPRSPLPPHKNEPAQPK